MKSNVPSIKKYAAAEIDPIKAKISALDRVLVAHDAMDKAIRGLINCISWAEVSEEPQCAVLVGIGGTGKTTVCNVVLNAHPAVMTETDDAFVRTTPAFYASVPSPTSIRSLAASLLEALGDPAPNRGSASKLTARLCTMLKVSKTKIILLDEFHHLLAEAKADAPRAVKICNWIKSLVNDAKVMVCLVGLPSCEELVNQNSQMSRRFCRRFRLDVLQPGTESEPGALADFLLDLGQVFEQRLNLRGFIEFNDHVQVMRVWAATDGNPSFVRVLLKEAAYIALAAGREFTTAEDFADAYDTGITQVMARTKSNPFLLTAAALKRELERKARR